MDNEILALILHAGNRKAVEQGNVLSRKKCTYMQPATDPDGEGECCICEGGELYHTYGYGSYDAIKTKLGKKCPHCGGTGFEPFIEWIDLSPDVKKGRRIQALHVNEAVIAPLEKIIMDLSKEKSILEKENEDLRKELQKFKSSDDSGYINQMW